MARKTANVVLGNAYGVVDGIAVDTHVRRLALAFGLTRCHNPVKIEKDLMAIIPRRDWLKATYLFIEYGRAYPARLRDHRGEPLEKFYQK
jgi:endonuclease-3